MFGLLNIGNTCYLNSTLQLLLNDIDFLNYLHKILEITRGRSVENLKRHSIINFLIDLTKSNNVNNPVHLKHILGSYDDMLKRHPSPMERGTLYFYS